MQRHARRLCAVLLTLLLLLPLAVFAQDSRAVWDLSGSYTINDLGISFNFPADWISDDGRSGNGITFATTQADLDAQTDNDRKTAAKGITLNITGLAADTVAEALSLEPTPENVLDFAARTGNITETESRVEIPVMGRRSLSLIGTDDNGRSGFATVWRQGDWVVVVNIDAPSMDMILNAAFSYGQLLGTMTPLGADPLSDNTMSLAGSGLEIPYPKGWYPGDQDGLVYQLKSDLTANSAEGALMIAYEDDPATIDLTAKSTLEDYVEYTVNYYALTDARREEFIINGQPAITLKGTDGSGQYGFITVTLQSGTPVTLGLIANSEADLDALEPTWVAILKQISFTRT